MATFPTTPRSALVEWCQAHEAVFQTHATEIGLTEPQVAAFKAAREAASAALLAQEQAKQARKVATQAADTACTTLRSSAGDTVRLIRAFAESAPDPAKVYGLAQIPPPAQPSPAPPPAKPTDLTVDLDPSGGALTLRWKAANPRGTSGTSYLVRRRLPGESQFAFIGVSGKKMIVDTTLPPGQDSVQYTVQGQRADVSGPLSPIFTVNFGRSPAGALTASVATGGTPDGASRPSLVDAIINSQPLRSSPSRERTRV